jgi:hypothetical protein
MLGGWVEWTLGYVGATKLARNDANLVRRLLWPPVRHRRHRAQGRLVHTTYGWIYMKQTRAYCTFGSN